MSEILVPTVFTRHGDTTHEDPVVQSNRIAVSVWQILVNERQHRMPVRATPVWISYVKIHPDKDHTDTLQAFRNTWAHNTLASDRTRFVELIAEPAETSEDIEAVGESFRKLRDNLSEALKGVLVAFTRATSETSTLVSWLQARHPGTTPREPSELEWTEEKNQRRCHLVDKKIDGTISRESLMLHPTPSCVASPGGATLYSIHTKLAHIRCIHLLHGVQASVGASAMPMDQSSCGLI